MWAGGGQAERLHGPLAKSPFLVTDNGSSFLARAFRRHIDGDYAHVRIGYRTPTQLGLLEHFHQTLKNEEETSFGGELYTRVPKLSLSHRTQGCQAYGRTL